MKLANDTIPLDKNIKTRPAPLRAPKFTHSQPPFHLRTHRCHFTHRCILAKLDEFSALRMIINSSCFHYFFDILVN